MPSSIKELLETRIKSQNRFFSIEITPKPDFILDLGSEFLENPPLFVSVTWIGDENLKYKPLIESPAFKTSLKISEAFPGKKNHEIYCF